MNSLERLLIENKPTQCKKCKGKVYILGKGKYYCRTCGYEQLDDYGKVKSFLDKNGSSSIVYISQTTGVDMEIVEKILLYENENFSRDSKYYLQCEKCGCSIREGKYCSNCVREVTGGIMTLINRDIQHQQFLESSKMAGKMHTKNWKRK